ncbi:beta-propeller fold lactonase family protein [Streptomyces purpurascens]|uniref:beta-propeller fold lactonase family protein n=1 Tax=Streptomyces purpurascens TaxID=1924 RepID=UPI0033F32F8C
MGVFTIERHGALKPVGWVSTQDIRPRFFGLESSGQRLFAANEATDIIEAPRLGRASNRPKSLQDNRSTQEEAMTRTRHEIGTLVMVGVGATATPSALSRVRQRPRPPRTGAYRSGPGSRGRALLSWYRRPILCAGQVSVDVPAVALASHIPSTRRVSAAICCVSPVATTRTGTPLTV